MEEDMVTKTLTSDIIQINDHAISYDANNENWIIDPGVLAESKNLSAVYSNGFSNNTLDNYGKVVADSPNETGVYLNDGNAAITNETGAEIYGTLRGVFINGGGTSVVNNLGRIIGASNAGDVSGGLTVSAGVEFSEQTRGVLLDNHGYIFGGDYGVYNLSNFSGGTIDNFKTIKSNGDGIYLVTEYKLETHITNATRGVISGGTDSILLATGQLHLVNHGTLTGNFVDETTEDNVIINTGKIKGEVFFGYGNDVFNGKGGTSGAIFAGGGGNDHIIAGNGNVKMHVGGGNSTFTAGPGHDSFIFDSFLFGQVEKITNFNPALDKIVLSEAHFPGVGPIGVPLPAADFHIGTHAVTGSQHIIYDANNGFLFFDPDGTGMDPQVHFATVSPHLALSHIAFLVEA
jgi:Ca2+-binding RTX toxin-like protein